jgi:hypothetical protein
MTKPASNELLGRTETADFPHMSPLGLYAVKQASEPMVLSQLEPAPWDMLHPGIAKPSFVDGLDKVGRCPSNLVAHPDPVTERVQKQQEREKSSGETSATSASGAMVSLAVVVMDCPILTKGPAPDHMLALVDNLVEAMAQTFCGYLVPYTGVNWKLPHVVFMTPLNAVRFCSALQLALLHVPWEIEDQKFQDPVQLTVMGRAVFQGPRVSMLVAHLPPDSYKWISIAQKSRTRGQMAASIAFQRTSISSGVRSNGSPPLPKNCRTLLHSKPVTQTLSSPSQHSHSRTDMHIQTDTHTHTHGRARNRATSSVHIKLNCSRLKPLVVMGTWTSTPPYTRTHNPPQHIADVANATRPSFAFISARSPALATCTCILTVFILEGRVLYIVFYRYRNRSAGNTLWVT